MIILHTGDGKGKTTAALGLAMRSLGHGRSVVMIQFMKGREDIGEFKFQEKVDSFKVYQFGTEGWVDLKNPSEDDIELAQQGMQAAERAMKSEPALLILDEINLAVSCGMVDVKDVLEMLENVPEKTTVVLTGRNAPKELIEKADLVTEMKDIKHPFEKGKKAEEGVEF